MNGRRTLEFGCRRCGRKFRVAFAVATEGGQGVFCAKCRKVPEGRWSLGRSRAYAERMARKLHPRGARAGEAPPVAPGDGDE